MSLHIEPIKITEKLDCCNKKINCKKLNSVPFRMLLVAPSHSGKTTLILNLLSSRFYGKVFKYDDITLISQTAFTDKKWDTLEKIQKYDVYNDKIISDIVEHQEMARTIQEKKKENESEQDVLIKKMLGNKKGKKKSIEWRHKLLILDDVIGSGFSKKHTHSYLDTLLPRMRHYKLSIIISTQKYNILSPLMRVNMDGIILFSISNKSEAKSIADEQSDGLSRDQFMHIWKIATKSKFGFMYIKKTEPPETQYRKGFDTILKITQE